MPNKNDLLMINAVLDATHDARNDSDAPLTAVTRRLFELVDEGERDVEVLKQAALSFSVAEPSVEVSE